MIDKIIPRHLDSDTDERLVEEGVMTDALNVVLSVTSDGTGGVLQNAVSTQAIEADGEGVSSTAVVIGSVSDSQRDRVYFFVHDTANADGDGIYMYTPSNNTYKKVFTSSWFDFDASYTVKADVVNAAFQQDGVLQTIVYFTDGNNQPRKINIDRALNNEYTGLSNSGLDIALSTMRSASTYSPLFRFVTDSSFSENNFHRNCFQFATQIVYNDNEVSALSPYSKIAVNPFTFFGAIEEGGYGVPSSENNVCIIKHQIDPSHPDVKSVRILARETNDGNFFIVDEFNPNENVRRSVFGTETTVYNSATKEYRFYNDSQGSVIDINTSTKLYDNVPLKAVGQTVVGNRLVFSNYTEGRPNHDVQANISVSYDETGSGYTELVSSSDFASMFSHTDSPFQQTIDLENATDISSTTVIPVGALFDFSFSFYPSMTVSDTGYIIKWEAVGLDEYLNTVETGPVGSSSIYLHNGTPNYFSFSGASDTTQNPTGLADQIQAALDQESIAVNYLADFSTTSPVGGVFTNIPVVAVFKFGEVTSSTNDQIVLKPRITNIFIDDSEFDPNDLIFSAGPVEYRPSDNENFSDMYPNAGNDQSEATYSNISNDPSGFSISISYSSVINTFKAGATHSFGIVYYDKFGRSGFVNEIGSAYVKYPAERNIGDEQKTASVSVSFASTETAPDWAESYQLVYDGSSVSDFFQYSVGGAYVKRKAETSGNLRLIDENTHSIYVSLKTLDIYREDKGVARDYSFTEGDKLRIVSYENSNASLGPEYPLSSNNHVIEFDVLGVVKDPEDIIHIDVQESHEGSAISQDPHAGTFLILGAPQVESTVGNTGSVNKYVGFDWYQITGNDYNTTDTVSAIANYWNRGVIVDIVSPKKFSSESIYYEIGDRRRIGVSRVPGVGPHGAGIKTNSGDCWYRPVACKGPVPVSGSWITISSTAEEIPEGWIYRHKFIEDRNITDLYESKDWSRGRAHTTFKNAATINRFNGLTWSDPYEEDVSVLSLSSFTPSTANFFSFDSKYGAVNYIDNLNSDLVALQENKMAIAAVNKEFLNYADGSSSVAVSNTVIGSPQYSSGDFGMGSDVSSVLLRDGQVFFADRSRRKIMRYSGGQLTPISDKGMSAWFDSKISSISSAKIVSGYDPESDIYYVTLDDETAGYNVPLGKWQSKYSFSPDCYSFINSRMLSFKSASIDGTDYIAHSHDGSTRLNFYGTPSEAEVTVVSKRSPDSVKTFNALSTHSDSAWGARITSDLGQDTGENNMPSNSFQEKEGAYYRDIPGNDTYSYLILGYVDSQDGAQLTLSRKLVGLSIPLGAVLAISTDDGESWPGTAVITNVRANERKIVTTSQTPLTGYLVAIKTLKSGVDGDRIRGHYAKISLTNSSSTKEELFSISTHISNSPLNHALGQ